MELTPRARRELRTIGFEPPSPDAAHGAARSAWWLRRSHVDDRMFAEAAGHVLMAAARRAYDVDEPAQLRWFALGADAHFTELLHETEIPPLDGD